MSTYKPQCHVCHLPVARMYVDRDIETDAMKFVFRCHGAREELVVEGRYWPWLNLVWRKGSISYAAFKSCGYPIPVLLARLTDKDLEV